MRSSSGSSPSSFTAVAAIARFCGLMILPMPPPISLTASRSCGLNPVWAATVECRLANRAPAEVADPVTAVPIQPRIGAKNAKAAPVPARAVPIATI